MDIIFELDSENSLKNDILRDLCATVYKTKYAVYFYVLISVNKYNTRAIINLGASGNFILSKIIKKFRLLK